MLLLFVALPLLFGLSQAYYPVPPPYGYQTNWYDGMAIDHFAFSDNRTFSMRYLWNDTWYKPGGPIFFYCGNEGDITMFLENTGFMFDIASTFNAYILFAEHRYYGLTQPFGNQSYRSLDNLGYLTTEQALADYAVFLRWFKHNDTRFNETPVIAFGGSYGGMLAAWMRIKYPHIITGSLAASAPILQFTGLTPCYTFNMIVTRTFANTGTGCDKCIKNSWDAINRLANKTDYDTLSQIFNLCPNSTIKSQANVTALKDWLNDIYGNLAMVDYPYAANFLSPVPAWPVNAVCAYMTNASASDVDLLTQIYNGVNVYINSTGTVGCNAFTSSEPADLGTGGWDFQSCTEMVMPMCSNGTDMFEPYAWDFQAVSDRCFKVAGVRPRENWATTEYGGNRLSAASNIIFSNGNLDPWSGGGVTTQIDGADTLIPLYINKAAHHYDLRGYNPNDTQDILDARKQEISIIQNWLHIPNASFAPKSCLLLIFALTSFMQLCQHFI